MTEERENLQRAELEYVTSELLMEFQRRFVEWNREYSTQKRDLGARAEFVNFWRKAKKVKAIVWEGDAESEYREDLRTILFEVVAHCFLLLFDVDHNKGQIPYVDPNSTLGKLMSSGAHGTFVFRPGGTTGICKTCNELIEQTTNGLWLHRIAADHKAELSDA